MSIGCPSSYSNEVIRCPFQAGPTYETLLDYPIAHVLVAHLISQDRVQWMHMPADSPLWTSWSSGIFKLHPQIVQRLLRSLHSPKPLVVLNPEALTSIIQVYAMSIDERARHQ